MEMYAFENPTRVIAGIILENVSPTGTTLSRVVRYKIRQIPAFTPTTMAAREVLGSNSDPKMINMSKNELTFQDIIERSIISVMTGLPIVEPGAGMEEMAYPCFLYDRFLVDMQSVIPLLLALSYLCTFATLVENIVYEKEHGITEVFPYSHGYLMFHNIIFGLHDAWNVLDNSRTVYIPSVVGLDDRSIRVNWTSLFEQLGHSPTVFTVGVLMVVILVESGVFFALALYIIKVFPGTQGIESRWYFPVASLIDTNSDEVSSEITTLSESEITDEQVVIIVEGKEIGGSTRVQVGLCPQHNVLFPSLTVFEHLRFYSALKNHELSQKEITRASLDMIVDLRLEDKCDENASSLSGGMQRRLCIGIAFIADLPLLLLAGQCSDCLSHAAHAIVLDNEIFPVNDVDNGILPKDLTLSKCSHLMTVNLCAWAETVVLLLSDLPLLLLAGQCSDCLSHAARAIVLDNEIFPVNDVYNGILPKDLTLSKCSHLMTVMGFVS
ncbi:unnamed protein product [Haemonchus placei]|uniref:ABC transporter domain-containing protein n=1 Tax=Haemonchus placei TaxID=6290 RepID=A0A3P7YBG4_HAEPC|nr:unnamed protein product [Haemonchus placei]